MNPLLNAQLGQSTHREYEAKYGRQYRREKEGQAQSTFPGWQKMAFAAGGVASLIVLASLIVAG